MTLKKRDKPLNTSAVIKNKSSQELAAKAQTQHVHRSVLLDEALRWWCPLDHPAHELTATTSMKSQVYIDCTFGRGGHSRSLVAQDPNAELIVFDKDPAAIAVAKSFQAEQKLLQNSQIHIAHSSFADIKQVVSKLGYFRQVQGVLMDLGVSSPQIDEAQRGFSFMRNGPLDMRMDTSKGQTAAQWINAVDEKTLADVIYRLGEEKQSRRIAKKIVEARAQQPIETTAQLADLVSSIVSRRAVGKHPATRTFQAIRMFINAELDDLRTGLEGAFESLAVGGRLVVLSFHSLEDRIVKQFMQRHSKPAELPRGLPIMAVDIAPPGMICVKNQKPAADEIAANSRARSAILRVIEKVAELSDSN